MKKVLTNLIVLICAIACVIGLAACEGKHNWSAEWSSNDSNHWHDCTDENCKKRQDITPHDWVLDFAENPATCLDPGWGQYKCSVCNRTKEDVIPAAGHQWRLKEEEVEIEPTCITSGRGTYFCSECGIEESKREIPPTGIHPFAETWSCDERGHYHTCTTPKCGAIDEIIPHVQGGVKVEQEKVDHGTNYRDQITKNVCKQCEYVLSQKVGLSPMIPTSFKPVIKLGAEEILIDSSNHLTLNKGRTYDFSFTDGLNEYGESVNKIPFLNDSDPQYNEPGLTYDYNGVYFYQIVGEGNLHQCYYYYAPGVNEYFKYQYGKLTVLNDMEMGEYKLLLRFEVHNIWGAKKDSNGRNTYEPVPYLRYGGEVLLSITVK